MLETDVARFRRWWGRERADFNERSELRRLAEVERIERIHELQRGKDIGPCYPFDYWLSGPHRARPRAVRPLWRFAEKDTASIEGAAL